MTTDKLLLEANTFLKDNEYIIWKPDYAPEAMAEDYTLDDLWSEGEVMFYQLERAKELINGLVSKLEYYLTTNS